MRNGVRPKAVARAADDACYLGDDPSPLAFVDAERLMTTHYRQAACARWVP